MSVGEEASAATPPALAIAPPPERASSRWTAGVGWAGGRESQGYGRRRLPESGPPPDAPRDLRLGRDPHPPPGQAPLPACRRGGELSGREGRRLPEGGKGAPETGGGRDPETPGGSGFPRGQRPKPAAQSWAAAVAPRGRIWRLPGSQQAALVVELLGRRAEARPVTRYGAKAGGFTVQPWGAKSAQGSPWGAQAPVGRDGGGLPPATRRAGERTDRLLAQPFQKPGQGSRGLRLKGSSLGLRTAAREGDPLPSGAGRGGILLRGANQRLQCSVLPQGPFPSAAI